MVCFHTSISVCNSVDRLPTTIMANTMNSLDSNHKTRLINNHNHNHLHRNRKISNSSSQNSYSKFPVDCDQSRSAAVDVLILIAVITAFGFLLFPYVKFLSINMVQIIGSIGYLVKEEMMENPLIYGSISLSVSLVAIGLWLVLICTSRRCRNPNCRGLRKAAEFDIQLETEECVKNSNILVKNGGVKRGLFELPRDHHRELEAELKKMAPPNGRAVLVFKARCGCSVGTLEVPGPKKQRKIKK